MRGPFVDPLFRYFYHHITIYDNIFLDWIRGYITPDSVILEIGAGKGINNPYDFGKLSKKVIGVDLDPRVLDNPNLNEALCIDFFENKFDDNSFDIIFANNVAEHIQNPQEFLAEVKRVIKPNGFFFFKTPNILHYAIIIAKFTPYWFHKFYCALSSRKPEDTFPTYYRMNSKRQIEKLSKIVNFTYEIKTLERQPDYLFLDPITFLMGVFYEKMVRVEFEK